MEKNGVISWRSPSNIAIVKYWGKLDQQIPRNPSLSLTLDKSATQTTIQYEPGNGNVEFYFEGSAKPEFEQKIIRFLNQLNLPFLRELNIRVDSMNTFPHSAGIASSASAMSALCLCITELEQKLGGIVENFSQLASIRSRLGSGSACRSLFPKAAVWGHIIQYNQTSDLYGVDWSDQLHEEFRQISDWIFLVNQKEKKVSSSAGHQLMNNHPYQYARIDQAKKNIVELINTLKIGDWEKFIWICEEEALSLHALMMSSSPGYLLLEPESIRIIQQIRAFRLQSRLPVCFTIDAGPNIHMLFPSAIKDSVQDWMKFTFGDYITGKKIIVDQTGNGPVKF